MERDVGRSHVVYLAEGVERAYILRKENIFILGARKDQASMQRKRFYGLPINDPSAIPFRVRDETRERDRKRVRTRMRKKETEE